MTMMRTTYTNSNALPRCSTRTAAMTAVSAAALLTSAHAQAGDRLIATVPVADFDVPTNTTFSWPADFGQVNEPVSGIGITAGYTGVRRDTQDGLGPWSLDVRIVATAPDGEQLSWNPIGGDVTIADYPFQDGTPGLAGVDGNGVWDFALSSTQPQSIWTYGLRDVQLHLLTHAPDITTTSTVTPDPMTSWSRPFFIEGVSGLGPVSYDAFEFTVSVSGVYTLTSVLTSGSDHFTCLYRGGFDDSQPLDNLLDYGLGNGFSPTGTPRGTSEISALLIAGETYHWITTQWSSSRPIGPSTNTIAGPGEPVAPGCDADFNNDSAVNILDVVAFITAWSANDAGTDFNNDGSFNVLDVVGFVTLWNSGCP